MSTPPKHALTGTAIALWLHSWPLVGRVAGSLDEHWSLPQMKTFGSILALLTGLALTLVHAAIAL